MNKILVSGGWGYGNLGDDALLIATVDLLLQKYPNSNIVIMSYDIVETEKVLASYNVNVIPSIHRIISKKLAFRKLGTWKKSVNYFALSQFAQRVVSRFRYPYLISKEETINKKHDKFLNEIINSSLYKEFETSDVFVMSGGGYFNSWIDNLTSRVIELELAKKAGLKSLVIGQSIGPFLSPKLSDFAYSGLKNANVISIRDVESLKELREMNLECDISPDLALANINFTVSETDEISIILGEFPFNKMDELVKGLLDASNTLQCSYKLLITRLYNADVVAIKKIYKILIEKGVKVKLIIPSTYNQLQSELAKSKVVVSRNLHGLIMGWRAGVPSVCLNNERKFVTFMDQSNQSERLIAVNDITSTKLASSIINAFKNKGDIEERRIFLSNLVTSNFMEKLELLENK